MKILGKTTPLALVALLALAGCGGGGGGGTTSTSSSSGGQTAASVDVTPCLTQKVTATRTVADLVVPDVLRLDLNAPQGFPNGRRLEDPVVDVILASVFLDLKVHSPATFASLPLNPTSGNDNKDFPEQTTFPYLGGAQGTPPAAGTGSGFVFRTDAPLAYTRVDRMGFPAVATALVSSANKTPFNDDTPAVDVTGKWVPEFTNTLKGLTTALADDLTALKLTPCAKIS